MSLFGYGRRVWDLFLLGYGRGIIEYMYLLGYGRGYVMVYSAKAEDIMALSILLG